jgi:rRNA maturation endonuclease Nob1
MDKTTAKYFWDIWYECNDCGDREITKRSKFCPHCGKKITKKEK